MPALAPVLHIPLSILSQAKPLNDYESLDPSPLDESDFKDFFYSFNKSRFRSRSESGTCSPLSSGSTSSSESDSDASETAALDDPEIQSIFFFDKDNYDFESELPPCTVINIKEMLDAPDAYDSRFETEGSTVPMRKESKELNPKARPFVPFASGDIPSRPPLPSNIRARVLDASSAFPLPPPKPKAVVAPWLSIFHSASLTPPSPTTSSVLASHALDLAHSHFWAESLSPTDSGSSSSALADLASHFTWKAASATSDVIRETMAPFAWEVFRALFDAFGEDTANSFIWHLRETVMRTFKGCWCTTESLKAISYRLTPAPSEEYVISATWLIAFIGDLFEVDLIRVQHIKMCINILIYELGKSGSLEHVTAMNVLVDHAGPRLWCHPGATNSVSPVLGLEPMSKGIIDEFSPDPGMIHLFLRNFLPKTVGLTDGSSVLAKSVESPKGTKEKDAKVQEVMEILAQWCPDLRA